MGLQNKPMDSKIRWSEVFDKIFNQNQGMMREQSVDLAT
jgi:hypothetical protein